KMEDRLVVAVCQCPQLNNVTLADYKDQDKKDLIWRMIRGQKALEKFKRHIYENSKITQRKKKWISGSQKVWKYFHMMSFLEPHIKERATSGNLTAEHSQEEHEIVLTLMPEEESEPSDLRFVTSDDATSESSLDQLQQPDDEDELYLHSLLPTFRRLSGAKKSLAKMEIMRVLHKVEFGEE
uniref:BESS domain-containing protein n=1 Tax=Periophthalmus magnuspinnatus TaxID=409849 RepID=A0A3B4ALX5_9GOBI